MKNNKDKSSKDGPALRPVQRVTLLSRVAAFYHRNFLDNPEGLRYLTKERGIRDLTLFEQFQVGLSTESLPLLETLPSSDQTINELIALGVLTESRRERLSGCVVFPLHNPEGVVVNFYGRRLTNGDDNHLLIALDRLGFWNIPAIRRSSSLLVTGSIIDAVTAIDNGFPETVAAFPELCTDEQWQFIKQCGVKRLVFVPKAVDAVRARTDAALVKLNGEGFVATAVALPAGEDVNSYLTGTHADDAKKSLHGKVAEAFTALVSPHAETSPISPVAVSGELYEQTEMGFKLSVHERRYEIKGISRETTQLKVTIKAVGDPRKGFELKTLDLYSERSREVYIRRCMVLFSESEPVIKADLNRVIEYAEAWKPIDPTVPIIPAPTEEEIARAEAFLRNPSLLDEILADFEVLGIAGEETNKLLCYLAVISRKLDDPLSLMIQSRSAAGKSTLQQATLLLVPKKIT